MVTRGYFGALTSRLDLIRLRLRDEVSGSNRWDCGANPVGKHR